MSDSALRNQWDSRMSNIKKVSEDANEEILHYFVYSTMPFISHRDVVVRKQQLVNYPEKNHFIYAFTSCEQESCPEIASHIRSNNKLTGYKFIPMANGTKIEWIQNIDVKGSIPEWIFRKQGVSM